MNDPADWFFQLRGSRTLLSWLIWLAGAVPTNIAVNGGVFCWRAFGGAFVLSVPLMAILGAYVHKKVEGEWKWLP